MSENKTYNGGCHCGKVRFEVKTSLDSVMACNCSICGKSGMLIAFAGADQFKLLSGEELLSDYQFGKKRIHHLFCQDCGVRSFGRGSAPDGTQMYAINARCLEDVDVEALTVKHFDGKSL